MRKRDSTRLNFIEKIPSPRVPIWMQLSLATMFVLALSITILSYIILQRQRDNLYDHTLKLGIVSLNYVVNNSKAPLLTGDTLALNTLVNNVASVDGHFYAFIIDTEGTIRAHTNHDKIDKPFTPFSNIEKMRRHGEVTYFSHLLPEQNSRVLNLSRPVLFQDKKLGEVHVGLSTEFIRALFIDERAFLGMATLLIVILGMITAVLVSLRFSRPISALVDATSHIARGNYDHRVELNRNDELGTLGEAFNRMGKELSKQMKMRESFGKYVGTKVVEMITEKPGQDWLKGRTAEAAILFADIRGFTAYAETREPEVVVEKLNEFFSVATEVILEYDGYIDKFIGDSVLAVFGVPGPQDDHMERSIRAAVAMQKRLLAASDSTNPLLSSIGIGIAAGVVVAGNIGSQVKMEYTVIGDSVNIASCLNSLAGPGEIVVAGTAGNELSGNYSSVQLAPQKIKDREELVDAFKITNLKDWTQ